jgi:hypothetical protein
VTVNERREAISERCRGLSKEGKAALIEEWKRANLPRFRDQDDKLRFDFTALSPGAMAALTRFLDKLPADAWESSEPDGPDSDEAGGSEESSGEPVVGTGESAEGDSGALTEDSSTDPVVNPQGAPPEWVTTPDDDDGHDVDEAELVEEPEPGPEPVETVDEAPECADPLCFEPADPESKLGLCTFHKEF